VRSNVTYLPDTSMISSKFENLKNFWVQKSGLRFVERSKLKPMKKLTTLCLSENEIEEIPGDSLDDLVNLEILWLNSNKIVKLEENLLENLTNLKVFDARNNLIKFLPSKLFESNKKLKTINLEFNSLKKIEVKFDGMKSLKWVVLGKNSCIDLSYCKNFDCLKAMKNLQEAVDGGC
jgi:Leucine-rich repeat (LRR) protein